MVLYVAVILRYPLLSMLVAVIYEDVTEKGTESHSIEVSVVKVRENRWEECDDVIIFISTCDLRKLVCHWKYLLKVSFWLVTIIHKMSTIRMEGETGFEISS